MRCALKTIVFVVLLLAAITTDGRTQFFCGMGAVLVFISILGEDE